MKNKCLACGVEKDMTQLEVYPYPEEDVVCDEPVEPLFELDCEPYEPHDREGPYRQVVVCHECFHRLSPDMWISSQCWERLKPVVPFEELPELD